MAETEAEAREATRKMLRDIHLVVLGDEELKIIGMRDIQIETNKKLDRDYSLLLPNRVLFGFWNLVKKPVSVILALAMIAMLYGVSAIDYIALKLGIK